MVQGKLDQRVWGRGFDVGVFAKKEMGDEGDQIGEIILLERT